MRDELINGLKIMKEDLQKGNIKKQIANLLTAFRLLSPFVLIPLFYFNNLELAFIMITIFALTDTFDGYFARKYKAVSSFGKYLDATTDKVFALTLLISLIIKTTLDSKNFYLIFLNIILECIICLINTLAFFKNLNPHTTVFGKIKTIFLFSLLALLYLSKIITIPSIFLFIYILITLFMQVITILSYIDQIKKRKVSLIV